MSRYTLSPDAREDLKAIYRYLANQSPPAAGRLREIFLDRFRLLARHPLLGQARDDLAEGLRMFPAGSYVILYRPSKVGIAVAHIVHSARDLDALFGRPE
jgi:plasmid stabilization system protein ParE